MTNTENAKPISVLITMDEWREIADWMNEGLLRDENSPQGHFLLVCEGTARTWVASDGTQTTIYRSDGPTPQGLDDPSEPFTMLVNSRFFRRSRPTDGVLTLEVQDGARVQTFETDGVSMTLPEHPGDFMDWRALQELVTGAPVAVDAATLMDACQSASVQPFGVTSNDKVYTWVWVENGQLHLESPWVDYPGTELVVPLEDGSDDTTPVLLEIKRLMSLLYPIGNNRCILRLPANDPMGAVGLSADSYEAVLAPTDRWCEERDRVETLLCEFLRVESIDTDDDGDYPVATPEGRRLWVRLHTATEPVTVQVFSVLAQPVEPSPGLFEELNSINASAPHVKVLWASDAVMAEVDLVAATIDMPELHNALQVVRRTADRYYDVLNAFFGAPAAADPNEGGVR